MEIAELPSPCPAKPLMIRSFFERTDHGSFSGLCFLVGEGHYARARAALAQANDDDARTPLLRELCVYNRLNTLAAVYHAQRGWLGASLSAAEVVTALYFRIMRLGDGVDDPGRDRLVLGKGHAAAMQYAALAGLGWLGPDQLLKYKQLGGPQAHPDLKTPGVECNTGSLGQALSKCCGLASGADYRVYVVLGDGELQEGQNFEAFMTMAHFGLNNVIPVIDRNGIQSDSNVADIMPIPDLSAVLGGLGLQVVTVDGNDIAAVCNCFAGIDAPQRPTVVIADTTKGAGISFMSAREAPRREYVWHGRAPDAGEYREAVTELAGQVASHLLREELDRFLGGPAAGSTRRKPAVRAPLSTGAAFGCELVKLGESHPAVRVLDADLEKSCRLTDFAAAFPDRFLEMGIAEQDMVAFAGGLALAGALPVVNTYASFFRRAYEQTYLNATERTRILYAGHYAGLCYAPDGKTHQCTGDVAMMRAIPGMLVVHPACPDEVGAAIRWYLDGDTEAPLYLRLHRRPPPGPALAPPQPFRFGYGVAMRDGDTDAILTSGPHMTAYCLRAAEILAARGRTTPAVFSISTLRHLAPAFVAELANGYERWFVVEELIAAGGLLDELTGAAAELRRQGTLAQWPDIYHRAVDDFTFSTLDDEGLYNHFRLNGQALAEFVAECLAGGRPPNAPR